mgnify:CR=1 FL=1
MSRKTVDIWERVAWFGSLPLIITLWELVVRAGVVNPVLFPPPSVVAVSMVDYAKSGMLAADLGWSVSRVAVGYLAGLEWVYWAGLAACAGLLCWPHVDIARRGLREVGMGFMSVNGAVGLLYGGVVVLATVLG